MAGFWQPTPGGIGLSLRVTPRAGTDAVDTVERRPDGHAVLHVRVRALADKGAANAAVIALLARSFAVPKSAVTLRSGATSRLKFLDIAGDVAVLSAIARRLEDPEAT